jgi:hypothetical protein
MKMSAGPPLDSSSHPPKEEPTELTTVALDVTAVPVGDGGDNIDDVTSSGKKLGRSCCGCCCDMRRAVIILSILGIFFSVISVTTNYLLYFDYDRSPIYDNTEPLTDDQKKTMNQLFYISTVLICGAVIFYALAIVGAVQYNTILLKFNVMYVIGNFIATTVLFFRAADNVAQFDYDFVNMIGPLIGTVMTVYANISLIKEIKCGIMSPETYRVREEQSCCCV